ncbi:VOC family protein [Polymorphospora sp. NPDC050346]|uniref:VOC family protein n=1 Tax=Polymorphospora sp. NPDC050346 TaxID=3155780 RepID=UPI003407E199
MHRSRLYGVFVDSPRAEADAAVSFWSAALGVTPERPADDEYTVLPGAAGHELAFEVQAVDDAPRYHLDIETDDVAAEVARLTALGAKEEARHDGWTILRAPGGHLLCVVPVQSDRPFFYRHARTFDS